MTIDAGSGTMLTALVDHKTSFIKKRTLENLSQTDADNVLDRGRYYECL